MSKNITCITPQAPIRQAIECMSNSRSSCVIVTENNRPIGVITERNIVQLILKTEDSPTLLDAPVSSVMSSPVITVHETETLFEAIVVYRSDKVRHLPVTNDQEELVGLVTQSDLTNAYFHLVELQAEIIENSIAEKTENLAAKNQELLLLSMEDHLMEIGNRRAMETDLQHTHEHAKKNDQHYSVVLLDVDYFKNYNDHYGHNAGDDALRLVADTLKNKIRGSDRLYRYGGEEILLLLPNCKAEHALGTAQRHLNSIAELEYTHEKSPFGFITASAGVGYIAPEQLADKSWQDVVALADKHLYNAKQAGRNQAKG